MPDPDIARAAEFLAAHAILLLALGLLAVAAAILAIFGAVRVAARFRPQFVRAFAVLVQLSRQSAALTGLLSRTGLTIPSAYAAVHLTLGLVLTAAVTVFVVIAEDVIGSGDMAAFDVLFARALQRTATPEWERFFGGVSRLGSREAITLAALAVGVVLFLTRGTLLAVAWIAAQAGGGLLNLTLKGAFERTRPEFADALLASSSWSFPSGHAMGTFILCGLGCYLVIRERQSWTAAGVVLAVSTLWCVLMAFSRLYLGVHFASDVIAGLVAGTAWVAVCVSALEAIRRRGGNHEAAG